MAAYNNPSNILATKGFRQSGELTPLGRPKRKAVGLMDLVTAEQNVVVYV